MGDQGKMLAARAVLAFSDACTIPQLTPECPFYVQTPEGATCAEECLEVLRELGVERPVISVTVLDGLVMTGVARPVGVATGLLPFDAAELYVNESAESVASASTTTLLLRLRHFASTQPSLRGATADLFFEIWGELEQRGVPVAGVLRVGVAPAVAEWVTQLAETADPVTSPWAVLFRACVETRPETGADFRDWFVGQVTEWFARLVDSDINAFLVWTPAPLSLFTNLPEGAGEPEARWIWDRFTETYLESWETASLVLEWNHARGNTPSGYSKRVLGARCIDQAMVADAALSRFTHQDTAPQGHRDLHTKQFVAQAARHLSEGRPGLAEEIFTALAYMNPADGEALNNLGFTLVAVSPARALGPLDRAANLPGGAGELNVVNRAFVRHLLGRDAEAIELLDAIDADHVRVLAWEEQGCGVFHLAECYLDEYAERLLVHMREIIADDV